MPEETGGTNLEKMFSQQIEALCRTTLASILKFTDVAEQRDEYPPVVYHYTDTSGFNGILSGGKLYATHIAFMNDSLEYIQAVNHIQNVLVKMNRNVDHPLFKILMEYVRGDVLTLADYPPAYIACFSQIGDDLSQWRGYCGGDGGFAIGFDTLTLKNTIDNRYGGRILIAPVLYWEHTAEELMNKFLGNTIDLFDIHAKNVKGDIEDFAWRWYLTWRFFAAPMGPLFKHNSFFGELEWRIIYFPEKDEINFRPQKSFLRPFAEIDLCRQIDKRNTERKLPLKIVYIGPGKYSEQSEFSARDFLYRNGYENLNVRRSDVSYRIIS